MLKITRCEKTVNSSDPTRYISYDIHVGPISVYIGEMWDVTSRIYFRGKEVLFTSPYIHKHINKLMEMIFNSQEDKHDEERAEQYDMPDFCWYCGEVDLRYSDGYVGETIISCNGCHAMLWEEPVTERMLA